MSKRKKEEKGSSDALALTLDQLTSDQIRFVVARQECATDKEAAESLGIRPDLVYRWKHAGAPINEAVQLMALDGLTTALHIRRRNLAKAMSVKVAGLDDEDDRLRQSVATEIIEWEMGRAMQGIRHTGTGDDGAILIQYVNDWRGPADDADD